MTGNGIPARDLVLSDGTRVTLREPGIALELEAADTIKGYAEFRERVGRDPDFYRDRMGDVYRFGALLVEFGTESPRFFRNPPPGFPSARRVGDLLEPDFQELVRAIGLLRAEALTRSAEFYRPIRAARGPSVSERPPESDASSELARVPFSE